MKRAREGHEEGSRVTGEIYEGGVVRRPPEATQCFV